jgi:hypothetical protein
VISSDWAQLAAVPTTSTIRPPTLIALLVVFLYLTAQCYQFRKLNRPYSRFVSLHEEIIKTTSKESDKLKLHTVMPVPTLLNGSETCAVKNKNITTWKKTRLDKLIVAQLFQELPAFYETRRLVVVFTITHHWLLSWASWIQSTPSHPISLKSILKWPPATSTVSDQKFVRISHLSDVWSTRLILRNFIIVTILFWVEIIQSDRKVTVHLLEVRTL